jgi:hypothetical protein
MGTLDTRMGTLDTRMGILDTRMGILGHLNGQPLEPEMGAFWSLMLLPMVPNVTLSDYGFVPLLSIDSQAELFLTNISQELFLPRTILLAVFSKEFFPRKTLFSGFSSWEKLSPSTAILSGD